MDGRGVVRPPYRSALRLYAIGVQRWAEVDAHYYQVDLLTVRIDRYLNFVYAWAIERAEKPEEWIMHLDDPLPGESPSAHVSEAAAEAEGAMFMAAMAQHQQLTGG